MRSEHFNPKLNHVDTEKLVQSVLQMAEDKQITSVKETSPSNVDRSKSRLKIKVGIFFVNRGNVFTFVFI